MPVQPRTPPGVLELLPPQQLAFQRMLDTIRRGFERFGFLPVETPVRFDQELSNGACCRIHAEGALQARAQCKLKADDALRSESQTVQPARANVS